LAKGFGRVETRVNQFDDGGDEKGQIGKDDAQQENVARFPVQPAEANDGDGDGYVEWNSDEATREIQNC
jgi:hypothetical protein